MRIVLLFLVVYSSIGYAQNSKVLIVGDSWAQQQYSDLVQCFEHIGVMRTSHKLHNKASFADNGHSPYQKG
jgi:hypothetical protein